MCYVEPTIFVGDSPHYTQTAEPTGDFVTINDERFYRITNVDQMPPFLMSVVSGADHWLFIASNGGLTAGRATAESALFPYDTEDKLIANREQVGGITVLRVTRNGRTQLWQPFSRYYAGLYRCERTLYKNVLGNALIFEEINHDLNLVWRAKWRSSDQFGFVRSCTVENKGQSCDVVLLDGLQSLLPYGTTTVLQNSMSNLLNAYKRNELDVSTGLGIFAMSATLTDRAEPSESLKATVAWQVGLDNPLHLLTNRQLDAFRRGGALTQERDERGRPGSYLLVNEVTLPSKAEQSWHIVADVNQSMSDVVRLTTMLQEESPSTIIERLEAEIAATSALLRNHIAAADGLQRTNDARISAHHVANVMFNVMRGGIFANGYQIERQDLINFVRQRNRPVLERERDWFRSLPHAIDVVALRDRAVATGDADLIRLSLEYLPLTFSRRHGDPSRPWNQFAINLKQEDGSPRLDYQGNWRDIFQNWEALLLSFPNYIENVIAKFLNATTADGYNPYRVTREGIEWEEPEPDNPWSNIGYWSDHQIIYLQKLLEMADHYRTTHNDRLWQQSIYSYADVPYRLRPYRQMLADWYQTVDFDSDHAQLIEARLSEVGSDGKLLHDSEGTIVHATMSEKLLLLLLAKLTNLVPDGGIWMNTQRPEWNDANNALVGKGLSVVTVGYLLRFVRSWQQQIASRESGPFMVNSSIALLFVEVHRILNEHRDQLTAGFSADQRRAFMDGLGMAASDYRQGLYKHGLAASRMAVDQADLQSFLASAADYLEHTLRANKRDDHLYHSYNILRITADGVEIDRLDPMLEGQVSILSSGLLSPEACVALLDALRNSDLYRADQSSYMLYPNRALRGFQEKNNVAAQDVAQLELIATLLADNDSRLIERDEQGSYHFNGNFRNANDVERLLDALAEDAAYQPLVNAERSAILALFEETFDHQSFTGRSGTFFAYEGLGSIYWHMVSKLLLAVQENYFAARAAGADAEVIDRLAAAYYEIQRGLGYHKSPANYGAFPTDPYSHTPLGSGASQPGMTGQVKEEILTRWGELGIQARAGRLQFDPALLHEEEFLTMAATFDYVDNQGRSKSLPLPEASLAFTICQTPVVYQMGNRPMIEVVGSDGSTTTIADYCLDEEHTQHIVNRDGKIAMLQVTIPLGGISDE